MFDFGAPSKRPLECLMSFPLLSVQIKFTSFTVSIELLFLDRLVFCRFKFYSKHLKLKVRNKLTSRILILLQPIINSIFIFVWRFRHHSIHIKGFWPRRNHLGACVCMLFYSRGMFTHWCQSNSFCLLADV